MGHTEAQQALPVGGQWPVQHHFEAPKVRVPACLAPTSSHHRGSKQADDRAWILYLEVSLNPNNLRPLP